MTDPIRSVSVGSQTYQIQENAQNKKYLADGKITLDELAEIGGGPKAGELPTGTSAMPDVTVKISLEKFQAAGFDVTALRTMMPGLEELASGSIPGRNTQAQTGLATTQDVTRSMSHYGKAANTFVDNRMANATHVDKSTSAGKAEWLMSQRGMHYDTALRGLQAPPCNMTQQGAAAFIANDRAVQSQKINALAERSFQQEAPGVYVTPISLGTGDGSGTAPIANLPLSTTIYQSDGATNSQGGVENAHVMTFAVPIKDPAAAMTISLKSGGGNQGGGDLSIQYGSHTLKFKMPESGTKPPALDCKLPPGITYDETTGILNCAQGPGTSSVEFTQSSNKLPMSGRTDGHPWDEVMTLAGITNVSNPVVTPDIRVTLPELPKKLPDPVKADLGKNFASDHAGFNDNEGLSDTTKTQVQAFGKFQAETKLPLKVTIDVSSANHAQEYGGYAGISTNPAPKSREEYANERFVTMDMQPTGAVTIKAGVDPVSSNWDRKPVFAETKKAIDAFKKEHPECKDMHANVFLAAGRALAALDAAQTELAAGGGTANMLDNAQIKLGVDEHGKDITMSVADLRKIVATLPADFR